MTMMKLGCGHWTTWLIAATLALAAACRSPKAEDTTVAADTVTKASTSPRRDSVRADSSAVAPGHTVLFGGATLVPFLLDGVAGNRELNQADGMHPNQRGEHIVADNVWRSLAPVLRQVATGL